MAWVKLDNGFREHRKVLRATPAGVCLWVCGLDYCNRQPARDGFIPAEVVPVLYPMPQPMQVAKRLVDAGLWEPTDGGFVVHDYHDYQPTAEDADAVSEKRREAGRRGGKQKAANRVARSQQAASKLPEENLANPTTVPGPVPVPEDLNLSPVSESVADPPDPGLSHHATRAPESPVEVSAAELQQRFAEWRHPDSGAPLLKPEAEWTRFRAWYAKRDPGPNANWHQLADAWLANIVEGYAQAGESKRGPRRVDRPAGEPTSLGDILTSALQKRGVG